MPDETLLTASRRAVRFFNIDMNAGGLIGVETQQAMETLHKMVEREDRIARGQSPTVAPRSEVMSEKKEG